MKKYFVFIAVMLVAAVAVLLVPFSTGEPKEDQHILGYSVDSGQTVATYELPDGQGDITNSLKSTHAEYHKDGQTIWSIDESFSTPSPDKKMGMVLVQNATNIIRLSDGTTLYTIPYRIQWDSARWVQDKKGNLLVYKSESSHFGPATKIVYTEVRINSVTGETSSKEIPSINLGFQ